MVAKKIKEIMIDRGFSFDKKIDGSKYDCEDSFIFIKDSDVNKYAENVIIVEIFTSGIWHLYYTQNGMVGFMDSGRFSRLDDNFLFSKTYELFSEQVNLLRDGIK